MNWKSVRRFCIDYTKTISRNWRHFILKFTNHCIIVMRSRWDIRKISWGSFQYLHYRIVGRYEIGTWIQIFGWLGNGVCEILKWLGIIIVMYLFIIVCISSYPVNCLYFQIMHVYYSLVHTKTRLVFVVSQTIPDKHEIYNIRRKCE